jgi:diaminopimelate decarboxylase
MDAAIADRPPCGLDDEALTSVGTPCFVFDPAVVIEDYTRLREALGTPLVVSVKANPTVDLFVRCAHAFTDGIELASIGELNLTVGRAAVPKYINTPALDAALIAAAITCRAVLILDNLHQLELVAAAARTTSSPLSIALRLNATSVLGGKLQPGHVDHFGMDRQTVAVAIDRSRDAGVKIAGLHVFAGSNTFPQYGLALCDAAEALIPELSERAGVPIEFISLGGGFPEDWDGLNFDRYRKRVACLQERIRVLHEAGRAIYARSGRYVTRVVATKILNGRPVVVCDGGLAHYFLLAQTEKVIKQARRPRIIANQRRSPRPLHAPATIIGNSCSRADVIGELVEGSMPEPGDMVVFERCGAYPTYSPTGFLNLRPAQRYIRS